jgi:DNA-directed RNA polymerase specialized sigma subunit
MDRKTIMFRTAEALDAMEGLEAAVTHRRYLADYSHTQIAAELHITEDESAQLATAGLKRIKNFVFDT